MKSVLPVFIAIVRPFSNRTLAAPLISMTHSFFGPRSHRPFGVTFPRDVMRSIFMDLLRNSGSKRSGFIGIVYRTPVRAP